MLNSAENNNAKEAAAIAALQYIENGMLVGLGTGTTAKYFISHLAEKCRQGLSIKAVATSHRSMQQAEESGIPLIDINLLSSVDITVDGADEIDAKFRLIKGGGGAALREKIVAGMSKQFIVIADERKRVQNFGKFPLALEILPFGHTATVAKLKKLGYSGKIREKTDGEKFVTDNGCYIFDVALSFPCENPEKDQEKIGNVVGVLETGFFINMASKVIIGYHDKSVEIFDLTLNENTDNK